MEKFNVVKVLANGVKVISIDAIEHDFVEAQRILNFSEYAQNIDAEYAYNDKVKAEKFVYSYEVLIDSNIDYKRFLKMLKDDRCYGKAGNELRAKYINNEISWDDYKTGLEKYETCECDKCESLLPTFEQWFNGRIIDEMGRELRLGKYLRKKGFSQSIVDFYGNTVRNDTKKYYISIVDHPQFIAGMTFYTNGSWSSCQNTREAGQYNLHLGGSLHDDKLYIAMLHEDLEDLEDMEGKLLARVNMRYFNIDNNDVLISTRFYGDIDEKEALKKGLNMLHEMNIFGENIRKYGHDIIEERANGHFELVRISDVHVCETIEEYVDVTCPLCNGNKTYEVETDFRTHKITCPACNGSGTIEASVYVEVDEWIEVEDSEEWLTYDEDFCHYGFKVSMRIDEDTLNDYLKLNRALEKKE